MKHPEYDSPFKLTMNDITTQMARNIDEMCWQAVQRVGINVDKEKLIIALKQDAERYREAYANGYDTGYEKRDDDIVRCKDCANCIKELNGNLYCDVLAIGYEPLGSKRVTEDWFCADGKCKELEGEV